MKEEEFFLFLYKFSRAQELMQWIDRATLLSKFQLHLQGSYQNDWHNILEATDPNEDCDANYFDEQVQNFLFDIFAEDEWSSMAHYIRTRCYKPTSLTTNQFYSRLRHLFNATQRLPNAPPALFPIEEQKRIFLRMFPGQWIKNFTNSGKSTSDETLQSIKRYMNKQECLHPYEEADHHDD
jgi:hypothetical protein